MKWILDSEQQNPGEKYICFVNKSTTIDEVSKKVITIKNRTLPKNR